ncbi:MAG: aminoglycoside phosphotransferase family protein [Verrucomicrobiia bacterium]
MDQALIIDRLREAGLVNGGEVVLRPLTGGVSSDIMVVETSSWRFVVKRALPKLRVRQDWFADPSRNRFEHAYLRYVGEFLPSAVPQVLHADDRAGYFAMEYLGEGFETWKSRLMAGRCHEATAVICALQLAAIHTRSWENPEVRGRFETTDFFRELRMEPYLLSMASAHPALASLLEAEVERIVSNRLCLVHGDYSPKNLLIGPDRLVIVDSEVAWFGDPAFDVCFLLNHLMLKALRLPEHRAALFGLARAFWKTYRSAMIPHLGQIEPHLPRLLAMLMLARVDGKSPVEYLNEAHLQETVRRFTHRCLREALPASPEDFFQSWNQALSSP